MQLEPYASRCRELATLCADRGPDALLVTSAPNVRYLTGFTGSNGAVLVSAAGVHLATDGRYDDQSRRETGLAPVITRDLFGALVAAARWEGVALLAIERDDVTLASFDEIASAAASDITLTARSGLVEELRICKDATEIETLRRASAIADAAFTAVTAGDVAGRTERDLAVALVESLRRRGAEAPAFATIVAAGVNGAEPHHVPTDYVLSPGDLVTVDMGARLDGYHSDMTRTFVVGTAQGWQRDVYAVVMAAHAAGRVAVCAGRPAAEVDVAARLVIEAAGYGANFVHGVGHGVGLQIHEAPMLFGATDLLLRDGMVVTVEPGVYLPGRGGVRIEDAFVVRGDAPEAITHAPYDTAIGHA